MKLFYSFVLISILTLCVASSAFAVPVPALPNDNLIQNPWFRDGQGKPSLDGWTDETPGQAAWSLSLKESNPSDDVNQSCPGTAQYCGSSARYAFGTGQGGGPGEAGVTGILSQVIAADSGKCGLAFSSYWVAGNQNELAQISISGSQTANGPWTVLWTPVDGTAGTLNWQGSPPSGQASCSASEGYNFFKIQFAARYPSNVNLGVKVTGVYLAQTDAACAAPSGSECEVGAVEVPGGNETSSDVDGGVITDGDAGTSGDGGGVSGIDDVDDGGGCSCSVAGSDERNALLPGLCFGLLALFLVRRKR